ncbi:hypothetical protein [Candidatus Pristimantibacillus sp. PTI5]|uniref:phage lytic cycle repressor MrpR family protein n=1 Tax=Candidatus Pristimantibacillus sp. PTI5 TaxID=3400422 RepID=UPI003B0246D5
MYNHEIKELFLQKFPKNTRVVYKSVFTKTESSEKLLEKDLFDFNLEEVSAFFLQLESLYISTARSYGRIITGYVSWAIELGYKSDTINPLKEVKTKWFDKFAMTERLYFSEIELTRIELNCENAQDAVIIRLLFEGVQGKAVSELRNLTISDVDFEGRILQLTDNDGSIRELLVSEKCIKLIKDAYEEMTYTKKNGRMGSYDNIRDYTELVDSEYIIRSSNTSKEKKSGAVDKHVIYRRISSIEEELELQNFNVKNISRSGMIKLARDRFIDHGELNLVDYVMIAKQFKISSSRTIMEFANYETITELYGRM